MGAEHGPGWVARTLGPAGGRRAAWRRRVARKVAAAGFAAAAVTLVVQALVPDPPERTRTVVVAARPVAAGSTLSAQDVRTVPYAVSLAPSSALTATSAAVGQRVAAPVGVGEVLTSTRLVGPDLLDALPEGSVAVQVPVPPDAAGLARPGRRVDAYLTGRDTPVVAAGIILDVSQARAAGLGVGDTDAHVLLAVTPAEAALIAAGQDLATGSGALTLAFR